MKIHQFLLPFELIIVATAAFVWSPKRAVTPSAPLMTIQHAPSPRYAAVLQPVYVASPAPPPPKATHSPPVPLGTIIVKGEWYDHGEEVTEESIGRAMSRLADCIYASVNRQDSLSVLKNKVAALAVAGTFAMRTLLSPPAGCDQKDLGAFLLLRPVHRHFAHPVRTPARQRLDTDVNRAVADPGARAGICGAGPFNRCRISHQRLRPDLPSIHAQWPCRSHREHGHFGWQSLSRSEPSGREACQPLNARAVGEAR